jgi:EAL domain-containing protein (putative c-di-GMP-specific phosphodiesterase class I)
MTGLVVELTEMDLAGCAPAVMLTLEELRARGATIAVDDFGTGFSNVHRIAMLQPDLIKLDMSLVRGVDVDRRLQGAIKATLVLAEHVGARVVAEGIETAAERDCLARLGVQLGQGYLLGRPAARGALV